MIAYHIFARNTQTGQRVQHQVLDGSLITQEDLAQDFANGLAAKMTSRSRQSWVGVVESYTVK